LDVGGILSEIHDEADLIPTLDVNTRRATNQLKLERLQKLSEEFDSLRGGGLKLEGKG
jgi:hypothetical protein